MSVLIKGMEMPKSCGRCWFNKSSLSCAITGSYIDRDDENRERLYDCPLVEVQEPHGRLIDADVLMRDINEYHLSDWIFQHWTASQQTVIEAEDGEVDL